MFSRLSRCAIEVWIERQDMAEDLNVRLTEGRNGGGV